MRSRRIRYRWPAAALVLLMAGAVVIGCRGLMVAQWRALVVLSVSLNTPVVTETADGLTDAPAVRDIVVAGVPTTIALPLGGGRHPAVIFFNGVTAAGRHERHVERLTRALGRAGFIAFVPDLPGLREGELTVRTLRSAVAVVEAVSRRADVSRTGLLGVSVGCSLAMLVAEEPLASAHLSAVAGLAPYTDLRAVIMMALTDRYPVRPGVLVRYRPDPFLSLVVARSLAAALPPGGGRNILRSRLLAIPDDDHAPLAGLRGVLPVGLGQPERALLSLLASRDPARFAALYARLPAPVRAGIAKLSPLPYAAALHIPVELASSPRDKYFPLVQYGPFLRASPMARLTVTSVLQHGIPHLSLGALTGTAHLDGFAVSSLRDFGPPVPINWLAVAVAVVALALVAAEGLGRHHGLVALLGVVALVASVPALPHPVGLPAPLDIAIVAILIGVALGVNEPARRRVAQLRG
jgi:dienelactone hydrolase